MSLAVLVEPGEHVGVQLGHEIENLCLDVVHAAAYSRKLTR